MSALEKLNEYIKAKRPVIDSHYIKLILEAICEGGVERISAEGVLYEIHADRLETDE